MSLIKRNVWTYTTLVLGWTALFWIPAAVISQNNPDWQGIFILHLLGGVGPLIASIFVVTKNHDWKQFSNKIIKVSGFPPYLWILILSPFIITVTGSFLFHRKLLISQDFLSAGAVYGLGLLFFGPIPEELGWRGVLFDEASKDSTLMGQILTVGVWLIWHLPLFFIVGSYQNKVGFATTGFAIWCIELISQSIFMGYLYLLTGRSIASAILFHYFVNLTGEMIEKNAGLELYVTIAYVLLAIMGIQLFRKYKKT